MTTHAKMVESAWEILAEAGVPGLTIENMAQSLSCTISELQHLLPSQASIILMLHDDIHRQAMQSIDKVDDSSQTHDLLFEAIMAHFDELEQHRVAVKRLWHDMLLTPSFWLEFRPHFSAACRNVLNYASVDTSGPTGSAKVFAFSAFCLTLLPVWLSDSSNDRSKIMTVVDQGLRRLGQFASYV